MVDEMFDLQKGGLSRMTQVFSLRNYKNRAALSTEMGKTDRETGVS